MLETRSLVALGKIGSVDLFPVLLKLSEEGWIPALLESQKTFLKLVGVLDRIPIVKARKSGGRMLANRVIVGDVLLKDDDLYYIVIASNDPYVRDETGGLVYVLNDDERSSLEIGVLSLNSAKLDDKLGAFAEMVERALKSNRMKSSPYWREVKPTTSRLNEITSSAEQTGLRFQRVKLLAEEIEAARVLSIKLARETLINIIQATFVRERDIFGKKMQNDIRQAIDQLKQTSLLEAVYLVECRKSGQGLMGMKSKESFTSDGMRNFICPICRSNLDKELLTEGYSSSSFGNKMTRQSYWMTVWITDLLVNVGIPQDAILWNVTDAGEEVDLLVEFLEQLWIFELKDREFGPGDAYPLNYRQARYRAQRIIIVTADKVAEQAKMVFEELAQASQSVRQRVKPIYIEGLENAETILRTLISETALRYAQRRLSLIGDSSGYDFNAIFSARFGESFQS